MWTLKITTQFKVFTCKHNCSQSNYSVRETEHDYDLTFSITFSSHTTLHTACHCVSNGVYSSNVVTNE
jgi:hypothetical protein